MGRGKDREKLMDICVGKWRKVYGYLGSEEMLHSYEEFFKKSK